MDAASSPFLIRFWGWGGSFLRAYTECMEIVFNPKDLVGKVTEIEKVILPTVLYKSLNRAVFRTSREELRDAAKNTFTQTVPFTLNSFLYDRPVQRGDNLESRIYIRDDAPKGNAPADYLKPQITGGPVYRTRFQRRLERKGIIGSFSGKYMVPNIVGRGRLPKGEYTRALWGIRAMEDVRVQGPMNKKRGYKTSGTYVWVPRNLADLSKGDDGIRAHAGRIRGLNKRDPGKLPPAGIYKVMAGGLRQVFIDVPDVPIVRRKFDFHAFAEDSIHDTFTEELLRNLKRI